MTSAGLLPQPAAHSSWLAGGSRSSSQALPQRQRLRPALRIPSAARGPTAVPLTHQPGRLEQRRHRNLSAASRSWSRQSPQRCVAGPPLPPRLWPQQQRQQHWAPLQPARALPGPPPQQQQLSCLPGCFSLPQPPRWLGRRRRLQRPLPLLPPPPPRAPPLRRCRHCVRWIWKNTLLCPPSSALSWRWRR